MEKTKMEVVGGYYDKKQEGSWPKENWEAYFADS